MAYDFRYPACIVSNGAGGWIASIVDVPGARTEASSPGELKEYALDALVTAIGFYEEDGRAFSRIRRKTPWLKRDRKRVYQFR